MKAVIFAAGRGTRMQALTDSTPKPLIKVGGTAILERTIRELPPVITDVYIVVGYLKDRIRSASLDQKYRGNIHLIDQGELDGTFDALKTAEDALGDEPFMVLNGDDLYRRQDLMRLSGSKPMCMLAKRIARPNRCSHLELDDGRRLTGIIPNADLPPAGVLPKTLTYTGACLLDGRVFSMKPERIESGELSLPHTIGKHLNSIPVQVLEAEYWLPVGTPDELRHAEQMLKA